MQCFFYGTMQIGSVLKSQCAKISDCDVFLFHTINDIKKKNRWDLDYESLTKTSDLERASALVNLTQVQKFLLALRDVECLQKIPYNHSIIKTQT